jgi:integrase/recombinase XerD
MDMTDEIPIERVLPRKVTENEGENEEDNIRLKLPKILTYEEIDRFLLAIEDIEDLVACRIMLFAGLRVAEATDLTVKDIHADTQSVFVDQGKGGKDRYAPVDIATIAIVHCYAHGVGLREDDKLFKSTKRTLQRHVELIYEKADITWGAGCHTLRHTCATWQLDKGIPMEVVRANLGHEDIATTQIYTHLNIRQRSRTYVESTRFGI